MPQSLELNLFRPDGYPGHVLFDVYQHFVFPLIFILPDDTIFALLKVTAQEGSFGCLYSFM